MKKIMSTGNLKLPLTLAFLVCFVIVALTANSRAPSIPATAGVNSARPIIVIDAGHGGADPGCVGVSGELEKNINLAIALNLRELLEFSGFTVIMTRETDISIHDEGIEGLRGQKLSDMENRKEIVRNYPDSVFISIHQNQFTEPQYFGAQMFYSTVNRNNFSLAQIMQSKFRELHPENNREAKLIDGELYLFKSTPQPALLIECGFLSNADDAGRLGNSDYQKEVSFTIYRGLIEFLNRKNNSNDVQTEDTDDQNQSGQSILFMQ
ncbi:MAG: N-acetylmuramoyl-L-alanine amidase [Oscillospiraceae bacterium]|jgi:N-acetylmuramoyl-L-alanine amidase|nr:N-acetylmuramoyl-L-alanine amidase [Oscillospiraceae bacterium]